MKRYISVEIDSSNIKVGKITKEIKIITKHHEYTIPIRGYIASKNELMQAQEDLRNETQKLRT